MGCRRLSVVVTNLLIAAGAAMEEGCAGPHRITIRGAARGNAVQLSVSDTGTAIPPGAQARIFEPYFATTSRRGRSGLELAACYGIVRSAGGSIHAEPQVTGGASFTVRLPRAGIGATPSPIDAPPRARILAVDEDELIRRALVRALRGYEVVASNGVQALRYLQAGERYDLILCEVEMAEIAGAELYGLLQELDPEQARRVVFITSGNEPGREAALRSTARRVLRKPFALATLTEVVAEELGRFGVD